MSTSSSFTAEITAAAPTRNYPGILSNAESRRSFRLAWKRFVRHDEPWAIHFVAFSLLLGRPLTVTFTPVKRPAKLANGRRPYDSALAATGLLALRAAHTASTPWLAELGLTQKDRERLSAAARAVSESSLLGEQR